MPSESPKSLTFGRSTPNRNASAQNGMAVRRVVPLPMSDRTGLARLWVKPSRLELKMTRVTANKLLLDGWGDRP